MGIESRDWYREQPRSRRGRVPAVGVLVVAFMLVAVVALSPRLSDRVGVGELPFGLGEQVGGPDTPGALRITPLPGGPGLSLMEQPLYDADDPWRAWLASETACPGGEAAQTSPGQAQTLLCLINYARQREGLRPLVLSSVLSAAARAKAEDIARCGRFEHTACDRPADQVARDVGYRGAFGENLYMAEGRLGAPRVAVDRWLNSDGHRENLFRAEWRTVGVALRADADVQDVRDGVIWVNEFGE